ncbi:hypothetical protein GCM10009552_00130 [Rothia nasimurium]
MIKRLALGRAGWWMLETDGIVAGQMQAHLEVALVDGNVYRRLPVYMGAQVPDRCGGCAAGQHQGDKDERGVAT